jgi:hypothetical protein
MHKGFAALSFVVALAVSGCGSHPPPQEGKREAEFHPPVEILLRYADKNGDVTRASMEAGLRKDFDAADTNHSGVLEPDEVLAVNEQRWKDAASASSPLVDWNHDGVVDFDEFAATARSLFDQLDAGGKGVIPARMLKALTMGPRQQDNTGDEGEHHGPRGRRGDGPEGGGPDEQWRAATPGQTWD